MMLRVSRLFADRSTNQRVSLLLAIAILGVVVIAAAWIVVTALMARARLDDARADAARLSVEVRSGRLEAAVTTAHSLTGHARSAHGLTTGPAWWVTSNLPGLGSPLATTRGVAAAVDSVAADADQLLSASSRLSAPGSSKAVDPGALADCARLLEQTNASARAATTRVAALSPSWVPAVSRGRTQVLGALRGVLPRLDEATRAAAALAPLVADPGPHRFFVAFMNESESRGLGGLPGAFAILTVDDGRPRFTHFGNDAELYGIRANVDLGRDFQDRYGQDNPTGDYRNSDISPNFPDAARIWASMWAKRSGQSIDGALVLDPTTLSDLLRATGPAVLADGTTVSADNVVALTEKDQYARYSDDAERDAFLDRISQAVATKLLSGTGQPAGIIRALLAASAERRVALWSADPNIESRIVAAGFGAALRPDSNFSGFVVTNAAGSKLDYYLERRTTYTRRSCSAGALATATLRLFNDAPRSGLPGYVTFRADEPTFATHPGDNRLLVTYYGSTGSSIRSVEIDGKSIAAGSSVERGLTTTTVDVELPVQASRTITVTLNEPAATGPPTQLKQPLVRPLLTQLGGACTGGG